MARVALLSDTHLGYTQYNNPAREEDFFAAFEQGISNALDEGVEAVLHGGDFFQDSRPTPDTLGRTIDQLKRLREADIPFFTVVGNHEGTNQMQWTDILSRLGLCIRLGREPVVVGDTAYYGQDYVSPSRRFELHYDFEPSDAEYSVLVAHGRFSQLTAGNWDLERLMAESEVKFDAILCGDDHKPAERHLEQTLVLYPGSTERTDAGQREPRRMCYVTTDRELADDPYTVTYEDVLLDTRPFRYLEIELTDGQGFETVAETIREADLEDAVALIELRGEGKPVIQSEVEELGGEQGAIEVRMFDRRNREVDEELVEAVEFASPEEAVKRRIREMELSVPAVGVEDDVRRDEIPKTKLADKVQQRTREMIDESPGEFDSVAELAPLEPDDDESDDETGENDTEAESAGDADQPPNTSTEQSPSDTEPSPEDADGLEEEWGDEFGHSAASDQEAEPDESPEKTEVPEADTVPEVDESPGENGLTDSPEPGEKGAESESADEEVSSSEAQSSDGQTGLGDF